MNKVRIGLVTGLVVAYACIAYAQTKISQLPIGSSLSGSELIPMVQSAQTVTTTPTNINALVSIGLSMPSPVFSVSGSPTNHGAISVVFESGLTGDEFLASPCSSSGSPTFRTICGADLPLINLGSGVTSVLPAANGGTGEAGAITGLTKANGTSAFTVAAATDVINPFTGCTGSGTQYLSAAGSCVTVSSGNDVSGTYVATLSGGSGGTSTTLTIQYDIIANQVFLHDTSTSNHTVTVGTSGNLTLTVNNTVSNPTNGLQWGGMLSGIILSSDTFGGQSGCYALDFNSPHVTVYIGRQLVSGSGASCNTSFTASSSAELTPAVFNASWPLN